MDVARGSFKGAQPDALRLIPRPFAGEALKLLGWMAAQQRTMGRPEVAPRHLSGRRKTLAKATPRRFGGGEGREPGATSVASHVWLLCRRVDPSGRADFGRSSP
jgi:hypothetical protein